jgi:hypothetical protein
MQIEAFCLCKSVPVNALNQPSLIDIFDLKIAAGEPILVDPFLVAASIRVFRTDEGQHKFSVTVTDPTGKSWTGPSEIVDFKDLPRDSITYFYVVQMPTAQLSFGRYEFSLQIDGARRAATVLHIEKGRL